MKEIDSQVNVILPIWIDIELDNSESNSVCDSMSTITSFAFTLSLERVCQANKTGHKF